MHTEPEEQHRWLQKLVGTWTVQEEFCPGSPDAEAQQSEGKTTGTETVRSLGELWVLAEGQGEMPGGGPAATLMTLGYDPRTGRFVGTWIGSMMTHLWVYDGELDAEQRVLTLEAEGPDFEAEGKLARYRDVIEVRSDDHRVLASYLLADDGEWRRFMTAHYRRTK
jgi:hypothetical protein